MEYGFVKVAAATPEIRVADCAFNTENVLELWRQADGQGCQLVVFPELVLTGYTCSDLFLQPVLLNGCLTGLKKLLEASRHLQSVAVVGAPLIHQGKLFNCAVVLQKGEVLGIVPKTSLPTYGEFYEQRHLKRRRPIPLFTATHWLPLAWRTLRPLAPSNSFTVPNNRILPSL